MTSRAPSPITVIKERPQNTEVQLLNRLNALNTELRAIDLKMDPSQRNTQIRALFSRISTLHNDNPTSLAVTSDKELFGEIPTNTNDMKAFFDELDRSAYGHFDFAVLKSEITALDAHPLRHENETVKNRLNTLKLVLRILGESAGNETEIAGQLNHYRSTLREIFTRSLPEDLTMLTKIREILELIQAIQEGAPENEAVQDDICRYGEARTKIQKITDQIRQLREVLQRICKPD